MIYNSFSNEIDFTLQLAIPDCDHCHRKGGDADYIQFSRCDVAMLHKAGMYTGHPANYWENKTGKEASVELYRLKTVMLKKPYEYMLMARENRDTEGNYEKLIFKLDRFILAWSKSEDSNVYITGR